MEVAAPPRLSRLADLLLRRPPSLRELVTLVGHADDYSWFVGLVRRLFPEEAEAVLAAPDIRSRNTVPSTSRADTTRAVNLLPSYAARIDSATRASCSPLQFATGPAIRAVHLPVLAASLTLKPTISMLATTTSTKGRT